MNIYAKSLMIAAALTGAAAPAMAAPANPAASLSVAKAVRANAATKHDSRLGQSAITVGIIGAIIALAVVLIATNDTPTSV